jgi:hypothetical protein
LNAQLGRFQIIEEYGPNGNSSSVITVSPDVTLNQALAAYHFFGFLWTNQLLHAFTLTTVAGAVSRYYWSLNKTREVLCLGFMFG